MQRINVSDARSAISEIVSAVQHKQERVLLVRYGKVVAAVVPADDLAGLEKLEAKAELRLYEDAKERIRREGSAPVPFAAAVKAIRAKDRRASARKRAKRGRR